MRTITTESHTHETRGAAAELAASVAARLSLRPRRDLRRAAGSRLCVLLRGAASQGHRTALVSEVVAPGARVLDIAAAGGNFSLTLAEMGYRVTWNDLRADLADYVRLKHDRGHLEFAPGNAFELEFAQPFDAALITEVIEHVAHPDRFLAEVAKLVRPGGYLIMTT